MPNKSNNGKYNRLHPTVSICTPTFNRRPFIPFMIKCFEHQTYPKSRMEWIIIDDGSDPIEDLVSHISNVKYFRYDTKMSLGRKRNLMHEKCSGDIIVYMDDDDYYPPDRVEHAVKTLLASPDALCAGSSVMFIYFKHIETMYKFGPYGPNHATAATFAFKKKLLQQTSYTDSANIAEERDFLKQYTIPFVQLDPLKTILVFSHIHNSCDKKKLLEAPNPKYVNKSDDITIESFKMTDELKQFYAHDIDNILETYSAGDISNKPEVVEQIQKIKEEREKRAQERKDLEKIYQAQCDEAMVKANANFNTKFTDQTNKYSQQLSDKDNIIDKLMKRVSKQKQQIEELELELEKVIK